MKRLVYFGLIFVSDSAIVLKGLVKYEGQNSIFFGCLLFLFSSKSIFSFDIRWRKRSNL